MGRWVWTDEMTEWVREHQDGKCSLEILPEFNEHFGLQMNSQSFRVTANRHGIRFGRGHAWKHIKPSPLKGRKYGPYPKERMQKLRESRTKFKVGETISTKCQGVYDLVKVSDAPGKTRYMRKNRYVYEQAYGPVPDDYCVIFLDGNPQNYSLDNLRAVPKQTIGYRRKFEKQTDPEAVKARNLMAELDFRSRNLEKKEEEE